MTSFLIRHFRQLGLTVWLYLNIEELIKIHHLNRINIHTGPGGLFLTRSLSIPVIVTSHHTYWQQSHYIRSQFWKRLFIPIEKKTYQIASRIICVSHDTKRILVDHYGISAEKITVIHNAVDTGRFKPLNKDKDRHSLLYVGRVDKRKGVEFLIRSMPLALQQVPDAMLLVAGKGTHLDKMKSLTIQLELEQNITFLGYVPDDQLNSLYNQTQCVVVPSMFEGFGLTVIEAIAAGTRVIGTDADGIRETLASTDFGRLVPYGDHHALAEAIVAELKEPKSAKLIDPEYQLDHFRTRYLDALSAPSVS
ncbi:MAG: glycosyltransferase family 4 protein [Geobacteraceae bacterium]|nr:glycosyltransferase family 4 protein [Geobacteraceae bacterium]